MPKRRIRRTECDYCGKKIRVKSPEGCAAFCMNCLQSLHGTYSECTNCPYLSTCQMRINDIEFNFPCNGAFQPPPSMPFLIEWERVTI